MPSWALKLGSLCITLLVVAGSYDYARLHLKNPAAPLQPPVADRTAGPPVGATPTPIPPLVGQRGGRTRPPATPAPFLNLQPGVQATALPQVTLTHVS
jgi:hypothetical protein